MEYFNKAKILKGLTDLSDDSLTSHSTDSRDKSFQDINCTEQQEKIHWST